MSDESDGTRECYRMPSSGVLSFRYASCPNAYLGILFYLYFPRHVCICIPRRGLSNVRTHVADSVWRDSHLAVLVCAVSGACVCAWRIAGSRTVESMRSFQRLRATSSSVRKRRLSADRESRLGWFPQLREKLIAPPSAVYTGRLHRLESTIFRFGDFARLPSRLPSSGSRAKKAPIKAVGRAGPFDLWPPWWKCH